ncbi:hypothetical protein ASC72_04655 [Flavobacterium sp. Root420]|nr:hypothetical protein ASC72_04655 [Flavobacterium sp. Root420]
MQTIKIKSNPVKINLKKKNKSDLSFIFRPKLNVLNYEEQFVFSLGIVYNEILKLTTLYLFLLLFCYYQKIAVIIEITIKKNKK